MFHLRPGVFAPLRFAFQFPASDLIRGWRFWSGRQQEILLQKAIQKETVDGELNAAIAMYRQILADPGEDRTVAAKALLQIGKCYEKLGSAEAPKAYEQLLSEYPDQRGRGKAGEAMGV
jgi:tetratricopeptide (TPR) repeat protein